VLLTHCRVCHCAMYSTVLYSVLHAHCRAQRGPVLTQDSGREHTGQVLQEQGGPQDLCAKKQTSRSQQQPREGSNS